MHDRISDKAYEEIDELSKLTYISNLFLKNENKARHVKKKTLILFSAYKMANINALYFVYSVLTKLLI